MFTINQFIICLCLSGAAISLFIAIYIITSQRTFQKIEKKTEYLPQSFPQKPMVGGFYLSLFLIIYALSFLSEAFSKSGLLTQNPHFLLVWEPLFYLIGPTIYFYVKSVTSGQTMAWRPKDFLHFIPALIALLLFIPFYDLSAADKLFLFEMEDLEINEDTNFDTPVMEAFILILPAIFFMWLQSFLYLFKSFKIIVSHLNKLKEFFSSIEDNNLNWLRNLLIIIFINWLISLLLNFSSWPDEYNNTITGITVTIDVGLIIVLCMNVLHMSLYAQNLPVPNKEEIKSSKYAKSSLTKIESSAILKKINDAMEHEKLFNDSLLSLSRLSSHSRTSAHHISQVINQECGCNFFDYVNKFRINEAKIRLALPEKTPILEIAHDIGFNSKSTFNAAFKRHTNQTPSEFRRSLKTS
jgi:AraC-like DNA-binding protein